MTEKGVESPPRLVWRTQNKKENWNWKQPESWRQMWSWCCCSSCVRGCSVQLQASTTSLSMSLSHPPTPTPTASPPNSPQGLTHSSGPVFYVFIYHWPTIHFHKHINYSPWGRRWLTLHFTAVGGGGRRRATVGARGGGERIRYPPHSSSRYPSENDCQGFSWSLFVFGWPVDKQQVLGYIW